MQGDIILKKKLTIGKEETAGELHDRLAEIGPETLLEALDLLATGNAERSPTRRSAGELYLQTHA